MRLHNTFFRALAAICLVSLLPSVLAAQGRQKVAVLEPTGGRQVTPGTKSVVRGAIEEGLTQAGRYSLLDRRRTDKVMASQGSQRGDPTDPRNIKRLGSQLGADLICTTEILKEGNGLNIQSSVIDVGSGEIRHRGSESLPTDTGRRVHEAAREMAARMMARVMGGGTTVTGAVTVKPAAPVSGAIKVESKTDGMSPKQVEDYVISQWARSGRLDSSNQCEYRGSVYRIRSSALGSSIYVSKDGNDNWQRLTYKNWQVAGQSVFVTGGDVYVAGRSQNDDAVMLWKNGVFQTLESWNKHKGSRASYVWVSGKQVFVGGSLNGKSALWLNDKLIWLDGKAYRR
jgi:TolB-like protein